jgi:hypothetical protein
MSLGYACYNNSRQDGRHLLVSFHAQVNTLIRHAFLPDQGYVDWHGVDDPDATGRQLLFDGCKVCGRIIIDDLTSMQSIVVVVGIDAQDDDLGAVGNAEEMRPTTPDVVSPQTPAFVTLT